MSQAETLAGCRVTSKVLDWLSCRGKPYEERSPPELGNWAAFAHFFGPKVSGDEAVTNGDKLGGMEFACFSGQKTESRARRASTSESGGSGTTLAV